MNLYSHHRIYTALLDNSQMSLVKPVLFFLRVLGREIQQLEIRREVLTSLCSFASENTLAHTSRLTWMENPGWNPF
jgi:hypothetical protein